MSELTSDFMDISVELSKFVNNQSVDLMDKIRKLFSENKEIENIGELVPFFIVSSGASYISSLFGNFLSYFKESVENGSFPKDCFNDLKEEMIYNLTEFMVAVFKDLKEREYNKNDLIKLKDDYLEEKENHPNVADIFDEMIAKINKSLN